MLLEQFTSVIHQPGIVYPTGENDYSPAMSYPEYAYPDAISPESNLVYDAVRNCLAQAGLDKENYGKPSWNPLGDLVDEGMQVFVLCNFVYHQRPQESIEQFFSKTTHASVIRAIIDYLLIAVGKQGRIRFGNAPVQSASWTSLLADTNIDKLVRFYGERDLPVEAVDLRTYVAEREQTGQITHFEERNQEQRVEIDLGSDSLLDEITESAENSFRVTDYDVTRMARFHSPGKHIYVINQLILESDVIFSVPTLKTHQKVGVTCGIKGCVGAIAHKDCLAHHRFGAASRGGDEYPRDPFRLRQMRSKFHDIVWQTDPLTRTGNILRMVDRGLRKAERTSGETVGGGWYGNDTAWRMALDIARVVAHADSDGVLHEKIIRPHYVLIDGILGGDGNGPLSPDVVNSDLLIFSSDLALGDYAATLAMYFHPSFVKLVQTAFELERYKLTHANPDESMLIFNGKQIGFEELVNQSLQPFAPPPMWVGHLEYDAKEKR